MGLSRWGRGAAALLLLTGVAAGAGAPITGHAAGGSGCTAGQWAVMPTPAAPGSALGAVLAVSPTDVWAAGTTSSGGDGIVSRQLPNVVQTDFFEHWDGTQWSVVPGAGVAGGSIVALAGVAGNDVWAFGSIAPLGLTTSTLVEHWDGTRWKVVTGATLPDSSLSSGVVLGPNDVWAYGRGPVGTNATTPGILEHWNGTVWTVFSDVGQGLGQMAATSDTDIWVAGFFTVTHWTGGPLPGGDYPAAMVNGQYAIAEGIADLGPGALWISGYSGNQQTDVQTWNGNGFTDTPVAGGPVPGIYWQMSAASSSDAWTVGEQYVPSSNRHLTAAAHWDGTQWTSIPPVNPSGSTDAALDAVSALPGQAWAVGRNTNSTGSSGLIETYCA